MKPCIFCDILSGESSASIVYRDERAAAFMDLNQPNPGKILVIPAAHVTNLFELQDLETAGHLFFVAAEAARALRRAFGVSDVNLIHGSGPLAGQEVPHLHLHVLPRWPHDGVTLSWARHPTPRAELQGLAKKIRDAWQPVDMTALPLARRVRREEAPSWPPKATSADWQELARAGGLRSNGPMGGERVVLELFAGLGGVARELVRTKEPQERATSATGSTPPAGEKLADALGDALLSAIKALEAYGLSGQTLLARALAKSGSPRLGEAQSGPEQ